ncbi:MAG: hypothetical protein K9H48_07830 [Melioribacteraceae bacterium]|nr:hypothetical protein [Melioribacteraceae bacterium]
MALSPLEIIEEDCGSENYIGTIIFSKKQVKTLVGKYYKLPNELLDGEWEVLDFETGKKLINKKIFIRSPITCQTPNFRICRKCFGERRFATKYVGIVAGQVISERITQLLMRSFHISGSANLSISDSDKLFLKDHLMDIEDHENEYHLIFNSNDFPQTIFEHRDFLKEEKFKLIFAKNEEDVHNKDTVSILNQLLELLKAKDNPVNGPVEYYEELLSYLLEIGTPYSSFIEMLFANMFLTNISENKFWRYNQDEKIVKKLSDKKLASNIDPRLGCLYEPNEKSLKKIDSLDNLENPSIYEKIWLGL